jgi:hypothetical protein
VVLEELFLPAKIRFRFEIAVSAQIGNMLEIVLQERIRRPASLLQIRMAFYLNWHVLFHVHDYCDFWLSGDNFAVNHCFHCVC